MKERLMFTAFRRKFEAKTTGMFVEAAIVVDSKRSSHSQKL
jgi:hypothetical protein